MDLRFLKIASIEFRHDYFLKSELNWNVEWPELYSTAFLPKIYPSQSTHHLLSDLGLRLRNSARGFDIFAEVVEDGGKFFIKNTHTKNSKLTFFVQAPSASWWHFTRASANKKSLCYFSNLIGQKTGGADNNLYLHNEIENSAPGTKQAATLVRSGDTVYEALSLTNTQPPGAHWQGLGDDKNFTTLQNQVETCQHNLLFSDGSLANKTLQVEDVYGRIVFEKAIQSDSTLTQLQVDITAFPEGFYTAKIDGNFYKEFYITAGNSTANAMAVIDIFLQNNPTDLPAPMQLDADWLPVGNGNGGIDAGEINPRNFIIHFLPNSARWKYILNKEIAIAAPDIAAAGYQKINDTTLLSNIALPINREAKGADFGLDFKFPAPGVSALNVQKNGSNQIEYYVSEIFINV